MSYVGPVHEFRKQLLECALRNGYGKYENAVFLRDGAAGLRSLADEMFPDAQQILDFWHLSENVSDFAKFVFGQNGSESKSWSDRVCGLLRASKTDSALLEIDRFKGLTARDCPVNLPQYIENNRDSIDYAEYERKGVFIGSRAIESGNKTVLQDRLKRAGMRWVEITAQYMLTLRAKEESGLWFEGVVLPFLEHCRRISK